MLIKMSTTSQKDNIEYYKPVNILITGGAGFIGRAVANYLVNKYNYKIIVVDILDYCSAVKHLDKPNATNACPSPKNATRTKESP